METYCVFYRCFKGPGYWGHFKDMKAFNLQHAIAKMQRIRDGYIAKHGVTGEFRVELNCTKKVVAPE